MSLDENGLSVDHDLAGGMFVEKWPSWIRWILFIPAAIIVPILFSLFQIILQEWFLDIGPNAFYLRFMRAIIYGGGIVIVGAVVAPKKQKVVALFLMIILSIISGMSFFGFIFLEGYSFSDILETIITIIAAGYTTYYVFQELK